MIDVDVPGRRGAVYPVAVGCPFAKGSVRDVSVLVIEGPEGTCPSVARPLTVWPDGSIRWALVSFTTPGAGRHEVRMRTPGSTLPDAPRVFVEDDGGIVRLSNQYLDVVLNRGGNDPIQEILYQGVSRVAGGEGLEILIDGASSRNGQIESIEVLESSLTRAKARICGDHRDEDGNRLFSYRLDVELWSEVPTLRLDYEFVNLEPGLAVKSVESIRLVVRPQLGEGVQPQLVQTHHGPWFQPRLATPGRDTEIIADWTRSWPYVPVLNCFGENEGDSRLESDLDSLWLISESWLGLVGPEVAAYLRLDDMTNLRPKRLMTSDGALAVELWPREAGALQVHQGRSRRHTITLVFVPRDERNEEDPAIIDELLCRPLYEGRATLDPDVFRRCAVFGQDRVLRPGRHTRIERYFFRLTGQISFATGLFDYGDTEDWSYREAYALDGRQPLRPGLEPVQWDPHAPDAIQPGNATRYEPVWTNNEYDLIHVLCTELMRTGHRGLWPSLKAAARHNVEVDFVKYSDDPYRHHGAPVHSAYHNSPARSRFFTTNPSHIWTQGLLEYYCLTGDIDALDVAIKLGDRIIRDLSDEESAPHLWGFNRDLGWALLSLSHLFDVTGETRFGDYAGKIADYLASYDLTAQDDPVYLTNIDPRESIQVQIVRAFFGYGAMVEGLAHYASVADRPDLERWLSGFLRESRDAATEILLAGEMSVPPPGSLGVYTGLRSDMNPVQNLIPHGMAIGYELTEEAQFLEVGMLSLEAMLDSLMWIHPITECKWISMPYRGLSRFLYHADTQGLLDRLDYASAKALRALSRQDK